VIPEVIIPGSQLLLSLFLGLLGYGARSNDSTLVCIAGGVGFPRSPLFLLDDVAPPMGPDAPIETSILSLGEFRFFLDLADLRLEEDSLPIFEVDLLNQVPTSLKDGHISTDFVLPFHKRGYPPWTMGSNVQHGRVFVLKNVGFKV
jgi:hypothetical protein